MHLTNRKLTTRPASPKTTGVIWLILLLTNVLFATQTSAQAKHHSSAEAGSNLVSEGLTSSTYETGFLARARVVSRLTADKYTPPPFSIVDPEKYYWPKLMARYQLYGTSDSACRAWLQICKDRPPFHFTLVGMARIMPLYADAEAMKATELNYLKAVFAVNNSYNAFTAEGTENHVNMSRTSGYIYAQIAYQKYPALFPEAKAQMEQVKTWLKWYSQRIFNVGNGEWNSSIYEAYNMIGYLNLYDFAQDPEVKAMAKVVLDYYATELAISYSFGTLGQAEMRGTGVKHTTDGSAVHLAWLWYGSDTIGQQLVNAMPSGYIQNMHAITSTYRPNLQMVAIARKQLLGKGINYEGTKPSYLLGTPDYIRQHYFTDKYFTLGSAQIPYLGFTGTTSQIVSWKLCINGAKPASRLSTNMIGGGPNTGLPEPLEVSGNGLYYANYEGKVQNPYTQVTQHRKVLMQLNCQPKNHAAIQTQINSLVADWSVAWLRDFKLRYPNDVAKHNVVNLCKDIIAQNGSFLTFPAGTEVLYKGGVGFVQLHNTFISFRTLDGTTPMPVAEYTLKANSKVGKEGGKPASKTDSKSVNVPSSQADHSAQDSRVVVTTKAEDGNLCGFVMEVGSRQQYLNMAAFITTITNRTKLKVIDKTITYGSADTEELAVTYTTAGTTTDAVVDWGYGPTTKQTEQLESIYKQPTWPSGEGFGRVSTYTVTPNKFIPLVAPQKTSNQASAKAAKSGTATTVFPFPIYRSDFVDLTDGILNLKFPGLAPYKVQYKTYPPMWQ